MQEENLDILVYEKKSLTIVKPLKDETHFIAWDTIETILFGDSRIYQDHEEFIIYLSKPPIITLKDDAWWLNKMFFWMTPKKSKKTRLRSDFIKGFDSFNENVKDYLENVFTINDHDLRKGKLVKKETKTIGNKTIITEKWEPVKAEKLRWQMVYDKHNRTVNDIYERDQSI